MTLDSASGQLVAKSQSPRKRVQAVGKLLVGAGEQVSVAIHRYCNRRLPSTRLNDFGMGTHLDGERNGRMSEVVDARPGPPDGGAFKGRDPDTVAKVGSADEAPIAGSKDAPLDRRWKLLEMTRRGWIVPT